MDQDGYCGQRRQSNQPEPEEHVDLLVDHVDWKQAQSIMGLYCPGASKLFINAFCHAREHASHRVCSNHRVRVNKRRNLKNL